MKTYLTNYLNYVTILMAEYTSNAEALKKDDRKDEANLYKVRANICDIFYKMVRASEKKLEAMRITEEVEKTIAFNEDYLNWFVKIPESWLANMDLARKHDDVIAVQMEEIKLETANLLKSKFIEFASEVTIVPSELSASASRKED